MRAFSAASAPIELKSSWPALVGIEPAPAGWASTWFSLTSAAAAYWAIISPLLTARAVGVRNGGSPA